MTAQIISQVRIRKLLDYDQDTGIMTWNKRSQDDFNNSVSWYWKSWNAKNAGNVAGSLKKYKDGKSYLSLRFDGREILTHRAIMLYMNGSIPEEVDHINGKGTDNRWSNLRIASNAINAKNHRRQSNNKSGITGVRYCRQNDRWVASIGVDGKKISRYFKSKIKAIAVRKAFEVAFDYHENHGSIRDL